MSGIIAQNSGRHTGLVKALSAGGTWNLIETLTASASSTLDFTSGIDSTYDEYVFKFIDMHPATDQGDIVFQADTGTNTSYNITMTTTYFWSAVREDAADHQFDYRGDLDIAQGTTFQHLIQDIGSDNDQSGCGTLHIYNPSSSTFVKHFISDTHTYYGGDYSMRVFAAGYFNTTTPLTRFQFKMSTGNIDAGQISLYGIT